LKQNLPFRGCADIDLSRNVKSHTFLNGPKSEHNPEGSKSHRLNPTASNEPDAPKSHPRIGHTDASERLQSVDILRGFDMFWISGGDHFFHALAAAAGWAWAIMLSKQLSHSQWAGFRFYDLIQPLFLFITGITLPLSVGRRLARGQTRWEVFRRLLTRTIWLILLGHLVKNGAVSLNFAHVRFTSVLGRIGVAGLAAGVIMMFTRLRAQILWVVGILVAYWALLTFVAAPGQPGPSYEQGVNIVDYLDQHIMPGRLASGNHDANGWSSTPPVVATVLLGALAGTWLLSVRPVRQKAFGLAGAGFVLLALGWLWGLQFPIIKHIWTSSYVLYAAGWSCLLLAFFCGIVDGLRWRRWSFLFLLIGMNPLAIYVLINTKLVDFHYIATFILGFSFAHASPAMSAVWLELAAMALQFLFLYWLYRRKLFWRV
jgi:predicted acyltransferase